MHSPIRRPLTRTAVLGVIFLAALLVAGIFVRNLVATSFRTAEQIRAARVLSADVLRHQLDEETGLRGFTTTRERLFLEPFEDGRAQMSGSLDRLDAALAALKLAEPAHAAADARSLNAGWLARIATPLLRSPRNNPLALERRGKAILDRFRADLALIDADLAEREAAVDAGAQHAIALIGAFVAAAIVVLIALALLFATQEVRLASRLARARARAEEERHRAGELAAAYEAEKRIADTLQDAFSQRPLPSVPSLRFSATYVPATEETKVGGDWYDAFELPDNRVLFVIGDVAGHGIDAAVTMNRARQSLVSSALLDSEPGRVLARANAELLRQRAPMVTAVTGFADARTFEFVYASAGHPPPLLVEPGRTPRMLACGSLPLGVLAGASYSTHRVQTVPGAMLVLYTDGAIEHSRDVLAGEALLLAAAARASEEAQADAASLIHDAIFAGRAVGDDVAILTVSFSLDRAADLTVSADSAESSFVGRLGRKAGTPLSAVGLLRRAS